MNAAERGGIPGSGDKGLRGGRESVASAPTAEALGLPRDLARDHGADIPNLFRFELADRWRGYCSFVGEPGGVRIWLLYGWDHRTYRRQSGYADD